MKKFPLLVLLAGFALDSRAQSFGDFLKSAATDAARQAVAVNVRQAVSSAVDSAARSVTQPGSAGNPAAAAAQAAPVAAGAPAARAATPPGCERIYATALPIGQRPASYQPETLWPDSCPVASYGDLKFARATAAKRAFVDASKLPCNDCEGGYYPDVWGWRAPGKSRSEPGDFVNALLALNEGESLKWKGNKFEVAVSASGAHPIGALPCRQFHYVLRDAGRQVAEYDTLYCEYTRPYASRPSWNEMI